MASPVDGAHVGGPRRGAGRVAAPVQGRMTTARRIGVIGAGAGGIGAAIKLRAAGFDDVVVLEQAGGVGGTWRHNRYPGSVV